MRGTQCFAGSDRRVELRHAQLIQHRGNQVAAGHQRLTDQYGVSSGPGVVHDVVRPADHTIYDEYAVNAIKLASPFPPVPPAIMATLRAGSLNAGEMRS